MDQDTATSVAYFVSGGTYLALYAGVLFTFHRRQTALRLKFLQGALPASVFTLVMALFDLDSVPDKITAGLWVFNTALCAFNVRQTRQLIRLDREIEELEYQLALYWTRP